MKIKRILLALFSLACLSLPLEAVAADAATTCACCAEPGQYGTRAIKPTTSDLAILEELKFTTANLYTNAASPENILGIAGLGDTYTINGGFQNRGWKLNFRDDKGKTGTLTLPMPASIVEFAADLFENDTGEPREPVLYKEWRFKFRVARGTGILQKGILPPTEYFLVLQGRGNNCVSSSDFKRWRVEITGRKASYAFYGTLKAE